MDMSRAAPSSSFSRPTRINPYLVLDAEELPSPTPSPAHLAAQQPSHMEIEVPTAAVYFKSKPMVMDAAEELPSPTLLAAYLAAQQSCAMEMEAPTAAVSSKASVDLEELPVTTPTAANPPSCPMETTLADASSSKPKFIMPHTVEEIFQDFSARRDALIRALTTDQEKLFDLYGPGENLLFLYGHDDGTWEVSVPEETAPKMDIPEPALALNRVRDEMPRFDWLSFVADRADAWLAGLPRFFGVYLNASERMRLFDMMNDLPTVHETFVEFYESIWLPANMPPSPDLMQNMYEPNNSSRAPAEENMTLSPDLMQNASNSNKESRTHAEENVPISPGLMQNVSNPNNDRRTHGEEDDEELEEASDRTFCAACGDPYHANGFWILCDFCDRWFHGKCVKITASVAESIHQYKCPDCRHEEIGK